MPGACSLPCNSWWALLRSDFTVASCETSSSWNLPCCSSTRRASSSWVGSSPGWAGAVFSCSSNHCNSACKSYKTNTRVEMRNISLVSLKFGMKVYNFNQFFSLFTCLLFSSKCHPLEAVPRLRDSHLQVSEYYSDLLFFNF